MTIRRAHPSEADVLTRIAHEAKTSVGYPPDWITRWRAELTLTEEESVILPVIAVLAMSQAAPATGAPAAAAIQAVETEFAAAWAEHDARRLASFWLEDGDFMSPFGQFARGREELERQFAGEHGSVMKASRYRFKLDSVRLVTPEVAVTDWSNVIEGMVAPDGTVLPPFPHHVTTVFVQRSGRWWKHSGRAMSLLPPPGEPARK
jgi:uncharacterized protein (TIGR02246 family)